jgi:DNA polymerase alpha-associated DNA helicase A
MIDLMLINSHLDIDMVKESLSSPVAPSQTELKAFLDRHDELLQLERAEEEEQTRLLNSNCSAKELERKGLSLGGLGVSNINVGLGGKT